MTPKKAQPRTGDGHSGTRVDSIMPLKSNCKFVNQIRGRSKVPTGDTGVGQDRKAEGRGVQGRRA